MYLFECMSPYRLHWQIYFWVLNCESDFDEAHSMGVPVGIVTDFPSKYLAYLEKHPELPRGTFSGKKLSPSNQ